MLCNICIASVSCIVISSQLISLLTMMVTWRSVILDWAVNLVHRPMLPSVVSVHHFTWVLKSCKAKAMTGNQTSGAWAASLTSFALSEVLSVSLIKRTWTSTNCSNVYQRVTSHRLPRNIAQSSVHSSLECYMSILISDSVSTRFASCVRHTRNIWQTDHKSIHILSWTTSSRS